MGVGLQHVNYFCGGSGGNTAQTITQVNSKSPPAANTFSGSTVRFLWLSRAEIIPSWARKDNPSHQRKWKCHLKEAIKGSLAKWTPPQDINVSLLWCIIDQISLFLFLKKRTCPFWFSSSISLEQHLLFATAAFHFQYPSSKCDQTLIYSAPSEDGMVGISPSLMSSYTKLVWLELLPR